MKKKADQIQKKAHQGINQRKGSSRLKTFDGVSKELERIKQGIGVAYAAEKLPGLKAMLNYTTNIQNNMELETFKKAEFNRKCMASIEELKSKLILPTGDKVDMHSITINTSSGKNISFPGDCPFPAKDEPIFTTRFKEKMDFIGEIFIDMLIKACDQELEIIETNFKHLKDNENGEAESKK